MLQSMLAQHSSQSIPVPLERDILGTMDIETLGDATPRPIYVVDPDLSNTQSSSSSGNSAARDPYGSPHGSRHRASSEGANISLATPKRSRSSSWRRNKKQSEDVERHLPAISGFPCLPTSLRPSNATSENSCPIQGHFSRQETTLCNLP